nr:MAG TPA: hypothetical protein [Caudoviricetes sp.]
MICRNLRISRARMFLPSGTISKQSRKTAATCVPRRFSERRGCGSKPAAVKC